MTLSIRKATVADIPFILDGNRVVDQKSYDVVPNPLTGDRLRNEIFSDTPKGHILIAEVDGQPAAFIIYSYCFFASEGEGMWVTNAYIDPFCRKKGISKAMLEELKRLNPKTSGIYGAIARTNTIARHFFSSLDATRYDDYLIYGFENDWGKIS